MAPSSSRLRSCTNTRWGTLSPFYMLCVIPAILIFGFISSVHQESNLTSNPETDVDVISSSSSSTSSTTTTYENNKNDQTSIQLSPNCNPSSPTNQKPKSSLTSTSTSTAQSYFNCFLDETLCTYYYPANFFHAECGIGKDYIHFTEQAEAMRKNRTLWNFMPSVGFPTITIDQACVAHVNETNTIEVKERGFRKPKRIFAPNDKITNTNKRNLDQMTLTNIGHYDYEDEEHGPAVCMTERLTMLHVHKAGGSSLHQAFNQMSSFPFTQLVRHKFFTPSQRPLGFSPNVPKNGGEDRMYNISRDALTHATVYPQDTFEPEQHVIFAVVRDPVDRFISSIGQALGAKGSGGNHIGKTIRNECVSGASTSGAVLKCIAKYVQTHGFWIELHFTPQVIDISFTTLFADVPIGIFSFRDLKTVLEYFGAGRVQLRDGKAEEYRTDPLLTNMTVADYDEETLQIVCEIYEMDVIMQRSLGMEVERCDPFIKK